MFPRYSTADDEDPARRRSLSCFWWFLFPMLVTAALEAPGLEMGTTQVVPAALRQMKAAMGGAQWDVIAVISAEGEKTSFGLTGKFHLVEDLRSGAFEASCDYGIFPNAEGMDRLGRWRQDNSGQVHPLDSREAQEVAVTESYLARHGFFFPERSPATFRRLDPVLEDSRGFDRIVVTPEDGRAVALWIDRSTHVLDRAVLELSLGTKIIHYGNYRVVGTIRLPFKVIVEHRDENETGIARIRSYQISKTPLEHELTRPAVLSDTAMVGEASATITRGYVDRDTGFFIVPARINGKGPFPFILDTGGHDILTPGAVRELGLPAMGKGFSQGAGAGSTPTEFTKVDRLDIGAATVSRQPFTILHIDLGRTKDGNAPSAPVAGILGLEVFERFAITIDYKNEAVTWQPILGSLYQGAGQGVPIRFTSDMPVVAAALDNHSGWFDLDTGNNVDLIVFRNWKLSSGLATGHEKGTGIDGNGAGGAVAMRVAGTGSLRIANKTLDNLRILIPSAQAGSLSARWEAGNFGNSVLSHFKVTFNYRSELVYLEP